MAINQLIKDCMKCQKQNPRYAYISPSYKMSKNIIWDYLKYYASNIPGTKYNEAELRADFINGGRIQLLGADNPDSLRGIYLDGVVLDEYAQIRPNLFPEIIRPTLADRKGYAIFTGTPKGKNHFYDVYKNALDNEKWYVAMHKASETSYVDDEELIDAKKDMSEDEYLQEWECSFEAAIKGAFYSEELKITRKENRICKVPYDRNLEVHTAWDIGWSDDTAIVMYQLLGKEIRIIDTLSGSGKTIADFARELKDKGYTYGKHYFPHDAFAKRMSDGKSTVDFAREYGIQATRTPQLTVLEGINQARNLFSRMWIDDRCKYFIEAISQYRREYDDKKQNFRQNPLHDWTSHFADAFRYMAISIKKENKSKYTEKDLERMKQQVQSRAAYLNPGKSPFSKKLQTSKY